MAVGPNGSWRTQGVFGFSFDTKKTDFFIVNRYLRE